LGAALALVLLSRVLEYLLGNHPVPTYGFFFGLVAASIVVPLSLLRRRSWIEVTTAVVAIAVTVGASEPSRRSEWSTERERVVREAAGDASPSPIVERSGGGGTPGLPRVFAAGAVAISAMILPGISGSFVLLLLGLYQDMLRAINEWNVLVLVTFLLGCLTGVILFVKFLNFLLARFYSPTMAFMTGLMVGSLWILWPVKERGYVGRVQHHILPNRWPASIDAPELGALIAALVGALLVVAFFLYNRKVARAGG
ncbi:MAG: DUF368 domain-containing protein, partial [Planctomycetota bacterium]|nr:DUF368 domain-containing protein [Planctomycetota bacterium]